MGRRRDGGSDNSGEERVRETDSLTHTHTSIIVHCPLVQVCVSLSVFVKKKNNKRYADLIERKKKRKKIYKAVTSEQQ